MKTILMILMSTLILSGCASGTDIQKLEAKQAVLDARLYTIEEDLNQIHDYLDKKHESDQKKYKSLKEMDMQINTKLNSHDTQIKSWQQGTPQ